MSTVAATGGSKAARVIGIISAVAGLVLIIAGGVTWGSVSSHLADENITVSEDAANFAGQPVTTPWTAFAQADIINHHALEATGGKTYAELDREDPLRDTAMNASFLRASLFTSVVAFGVAALVMGLGVMFILVGYALWAIAGRSVATVAETRSTTPADAGLKA
ncbi:MULTISPECIES: aromatic ring-opening dioxygenase LigA [unclassified Cellulomonas]|uniref:aromatic ring-opening dioxygenase LigA n=1 Tax=unclassified Cellulomonas TaxID=2620175 RepID=UPI0024B6B1DA|nr:aromatic ring-opening dioxygenase LigA [Cellulomonas sp. ES6]WHP17041.1 aromatic ring-opening dioxygenase LigA [Cellulomonas sp. ES6]